MPSLLLLPILDGRTINLTMSMAFPTMLAHKWRACNFPAVVATYMRLISPTSASQAPKLCAKEQLIVTGLLSDVVGNDKLTGLECYIQPCRILTIFEIYSLLHSTETDIYHQEHPMQGTHPKHQSTQSKSVAKRASRSLIPYQCPKP